jgi:hypothetical protein
LLSFFGDHDAIGGCGWVDPSQSAIYHWTELDRLAFADPPRPEIARFGFSCSLTVISALADQSTS